eukprot:TRINITY_DN1093_c0_g2_i1.p1 TRINITY_DN1093_c0_g2~~TRINITY_DN1093_c0_g2_i1.p1  ORF type:complete len:262 (-),score=29.88 TRINITY_DN1093_c0_g2_i1:210-995(-)
MTSKNPAVSQVKTNGIRKIPAMKKNGKILPTVAVSSSSSSSFASSARHNSGLPFSNIVPHDAAQVNGTPGLSHGLKTSSNTLNKSGSNFPMNGHTNGHSIGNSTLSTSPSTLKRERGMVPSSSNSLSRPRYQSNTINHIETKPLFSSSLPSTVPHSSSSPGLRTSMPLGNQSNLQPRQHLHPISQGNNQRPSLTPEVKSHHDLLRLHNEEFRVQKAKKDALKEAQASFGRFVGIDSKYGNMIIPVLPRIDLSGESSEQMGT